MTGPEHYCEAERLLAISTADNPVTAAEAQVHATLALAAAMAPRPPGRTAHDDWRSAIYGQWEES